MRQHAAKVYRLRPVYMSNASIAASVAAKAAREAPLTQSSMGISAGNVGIPGIAVEINNVSVAPPIRCIATNPNEIAGVRVSCGRARKRIAAISTAEVTLGTQPAEVSQSPVLRPCMK